MRIIGLLIVSSLALSSCDLLNQAGASAVTTEEVVKGLKEALTMGTDVATSKLNATDGYWKDAAVRLILPKEALYADSIRKTSMFKGITDGLQLTSTLENTFEQTKLGINRAAEGAASDAKPIFVDAITNLSISDGWEILNGKNPTTTKAGTETATFDSSAATSYLKSTTFTQLTSVFSKPIKEQLDKKMAVGFSASDAWNNLTSSYNKGVEGYNKAVDLNNLNPFKSTQMEKLTPINVDLASYATGKALDGLFLKVGEQEKEIRRNPFKWGKDIIERVFSEGIKQLSK